MNAHKLANILLSGEDYPVAIPLNYRGAEMVENISILQNDESPFEYAILLEGKFSIRLNDEITVNQ